MGSVRALAGKGTLFLDFRYRGESCRDYTALSDTAANRKRLEKALRAIEEEIAAGTFDYEKRFPGSKRSNTPLAAAVQWMASTSGSTPPWRPEHFASMCAFFSAKCQ